jgi:hypothetical protein
MGQRVIAKAARPLPIRPHISLNSPRFQSAGVVLLLALAVLAVYFPFRTHPQDNTLLGIDYFQVHLHRMKFAEEALLSPNPHLPGWYPRELLGTPFWSNIQSFPLLPTRLILLLFDPLDAYAVGVIMAAELSALFTFLFARTLGLSRIASAVGAWTFTCSGFFAAGIMCGHLPVLEAYCALPLMLWLVHRCLVSPPGGARRNALRVLGIVTTLICFAGHPQIPAYAIAAAIAYALWMNVRRPTRPGEGNRIGTSQILSAIILGIGMAAVVLWPMALLVRRSSRILPLDLPLNDVAFPYERLLSFISPWRDGWPPLVPRFPAMPWRRGDVSAFWESVCYVGLAPLAAAILWLGVAIARRTLPRRNWAYILAIGVTGMLLALPPMHEAMAHLPVTLLRSPARLVYFPIFSLSLGLAAAVDWTWANSSRRTWVAIGLTAILAAHAADLSWHDRYFVRTYHLGDFGPDDQQIAQAVGDGRAGIDSISTLAINREVDDVGYFDSIALAKSYRAIFDLAHLPPRMNLEYIDGSNLDLRAFRLCAVRVIATNKIPLDQATSRNPEPLYGIANSANRVDFFPLALTVIADPSTIHAHLRDANYDLMHRLLIPVGSPAPADNGAPERLPTTLTYNRDSEDKMTISATVPQAGYLRIDEAWDLGWHATVDGKSVPLIAGDDVFLTLPLSAGYHNVKLEFSTPGAITGWIISIACFGMLMWMTRSRRGNMRI